MNKLKKLKKSLSNYEKVAIAYSGGVDSSFLAKVAYETLGKNAIAIMIIGDMQPQSEVIEARNLAKKIGIELVEINIKGKHIPEFNLNKKDRCYHCKKFLFEKIKKEADKYGISIILDGTNLDDTKDYRPGLIALEELTIQSPLKECMMTKEDIRTFSKEFSLETWSKPSFACLASRIPYGEKITTNKLKMVELGEEYLKERGITQYRVRHHGDIARIEVEKHEMKKILFDDSFVDLVTYFETLGFKYVTLDLKGYITGSMNKFKEDQKI